MSVSLCTAICNCLTDGIQVSSLRDPVLKLPQRTTWPLCVYFDSFLGSHDVGIVKITLFWCGSSWIIGWVSIMRHANTQNKEKLVNISYKYLQDYFHSMYKNIAFEILWKFKNDQRKIVPDLFVFEFSENTDRVYFDQPSLQWLFWNERHKNMEGTLQWMMLVRSKICIFTHSFEKTQCLCNSLYPLRAFVLTDVLLHE